MAIVEKLGKKIVKKNYQKKNRFNGFKEEREGWQPRESTY